MRRLEATIDRIEECRLATGQVLTVVTLSVSYLQALQFEQLLNVGRPQTAKRRKHRQPATPPRELKTWLRLDDGSRVRVDATLAMSAPLDAPAQLTLLSPPEGIAKGQQIGMEIEESDSRRPI